MAGFEVTGVDIKPQPNYPYNFVQADILEYLANNWQKYDAIHLSPPCQKHSASTAVHKSKGYEYPDIIPQLREILSNIPLPWVMENVSNAGLRPDIVLYGTMFSLRVKRKRIFELGNWFCLQPSNQRTNKGVVTGDFVSVFGHTSLKKSKGKLIEPNFREGTILNTWKIAMGVDTTIKIKDVELSQGIPPAYTKYIGAQLKDFIKYKQSHNDNNRLQPHA